MNGVREEEHIKLPDHTLPSDYSDVQPASYDPDFISQISSKMQVPHRIAVDGGYGNKENGSFTGGSLNGPSFSGMTVPEKIVVAGDNQHIGMRSDLALDLQTKDQAPSESMSYVGLITPPRTLTLEESFPTVDEYSDLKQGQPQVRDASAAPAHFNGHIAAPVPYDPGVNLEDSLLLNEEDEATLLRTQVAKLTRRVQVIEQDSLKRAHRELVLYPVILGYFVWKILGWFIRDR